MYSAGYAPSIRCARALSGSRSITDAEPGPVAENGPPDPRCDTALGWVCRFALANSPGRGTMTDEIKQPLEETPEVAAAVADDVAVDAFVTGGGPDADNPEFLEPGAEPAVRT